MINFTSWLEDVDATAWLLWWKCSHSGQRHASSCDQSAGCIFAADSVNTAFSVSVSGCCLLLCCGQLKWLLIIDLKLSSKNF